MNPETVDQFKFRTKFISALRRTLDGDGFMEIDTPILSTKASGAAARPFKSWHNSLAMDVFLRIAPKRT
jgi:lysyl-tRNA synthetase class 2